ncbi:MAG: hypothetical protein DRP81_08590 [Candidatus Omnitrophota bacterium]|nr:MAG: hypothetical protein DRP81_08590 [Candidatus Omnitrophota bacterium]
MKIKLIKTQRVLAPTQITLAPFCINPYRGCEFGCLYCYTKLTKIAQRDKETLGVKINAPLILEKELKYRNVEKVILGSSCECFTYAELTYGISKKIIQILNKNNISYTILTKSPLIQKYLSLIKVNKKNCIFFTFNFSKEKIKSLIEENSPSLKRRLAVIREIKRVGIPLRIHIGPFIPYLSSLEEIFPLIKGLTTEVNIELYHSKMGSFFEILEKIKKVDEGLSKSIENIYRDRESYYNFSEKLKETTLQLNKKYNFKLYFIIPDFDKFYNSKITYESTIF